MNWMKYNEKNCDICGNLYKYDSRQKISKYCSQRCRGISIRQRNINGELGIDYVLCEICNLKFREINSDHLSLHDISCDGYDKIYNKSRTSSKTSIRKDTLSKQMSPELSHKLSNSHKIDNYIEKYGEIEGEIRYRKMIENKTYRNSYQSYKDKYGELEGYLKYREVQNKKVNSLENKITKYGLEEGTKKYEEFTIKQKVKSTLSNFIYKYGYDDGLKRWLDKNNKISISNSKIERKDKKDFINYISDVCKYTRISLNMNNLINIELRGHENGYDLDHIVSKVDGYRNKVPSYIIGHISNLRVINSSQNRKKQHKSDLNISYIVDKFENDELYKELIKDIISNSNK